MTARAAALLTVAALLAAGLTHASSARYAVADNDVIHSDGIQGSGADPAGGGVIHGF